PGPGGRLPGEPAGRGRGEGGRGDRRRRAGICCSGAGQHGIAPAAACCKCAGAASGAGTRQHPALTVAAARETAFPRRCPDSKFANPAARSHANFGIKETPASLWFYAPFGTRRAQSDWPQAHADFGFGALAAKPVAHGTGLLPGGGLLVITTARGHEVAMTRNNGAIRLVAGNSNPALAEAIG